MSLESTGCRLDRWLLEYLQTAQTTNPFDSHRANDESQRQRLRLSARLRDFHFSRWGGNKVELRWEGEEWSYCEGTVGSKGLLHPKINMNMKIMRKLCNSMSLTASFIDFAAIKWSTSSRLDIIMQTTAKYNFSPSSWSKSTISAEKNPMSPWVELSTIAFVSGPAIVCNFLSPTTHVRAINELIAKFMIQFLWAIIVENAARWRCDVF